MFCLPRHHPTSPDAGMSSEILLRLFVLNGCISFQSLLTERHLVSAHNVSLLFVPSETFRT
jgi:hypothetical protein